MDFTLALAVPAFTLATFGSTTLAVWGELLLFRLGGIPEGIRLVSGATYPRLTGTLAMLVAFVGLAATARSRPRVESPPS